MSVDDNNQFILKRGQTLGGIMTNMIILENIILHIILALLAVLKSLKYICIVLVILSHFLVRLG